MTQFFTRAPDNPSTGSPAYAQSVLSYYYQNHLSGMVEVDTLDDQFVFLISDGWRVGAYRSVDGCYTVVPGEDILEYWSAGDAHIRSIKLPRHGVRAVKQGLEWFPPVFSLDLPAADIPALLERFEMEGFNGLVHLLWERSEGFLTFHSGQIIPGDTLYASISQVGAGAEAHRRLLAEKSPVCRAACYAYREGTPAADQHLLRLTLSAWAGHILQRYLQLVGRSLINSLAHEMNSFLRARSLHIELTGEALHDQHVFVSNESCIQAYQTLIRAMASHMGKVIGGGLTNAVFYDSYQKLDATDQRVLSRHSLLPAFIH
jgi:hypothetical protein